MSDATSAPAYRPGTIQQAICSHCGGTVRIHVPDCRSREIRLWWPGPLALIIWLALVWKFGNFLASPRVETATSAPMEASFVELPEVAPDKNAAVQPQPLPKQSEPSVEPRPDALPSPDRVEINPVAPLNTAPEPNLAPATDLMAYVNAARARRQADEMAAAHENVAAATRERGPSEDEIRMANILRNLQPQGTNGVFQIINIGLRSAKYSFRGWTRDASSASREVIEVDAGPGGNIEREIVRSMIALIRRYYKGNFNWESRRLDRVIVLSARLEDNAALEDFLMREFFVAGAGVY